MSNVDIFRIFSCFVKGEKAFACPSGRRHHSRHQPLPAPMRPPKTPVSQSHTLSNGCRLSPCTGAELCDSHRRRRRAMTQGRPSSLEAARRAVFRLLPEPTAKCSGAFADDLPGLRDTLPGGTTTSDVPAAQKDTLFLTVPANRLSLPCAVRQSQNRHACGEHGKCSVLRRKRLIKKGGRPKNGRLSEITLRLRREDGTPVAVNPRHACLRWA